MVLQKSKTFTNLNRSDSGMVTYNSVNIIYQYSAYIIVIYCGIIITGQGGVLGYQPHYRQTHLRPFGLRSANDLLRMMVYCQKKRAPYKTILMKNVTIRIPK